MAITGLKAPGNRKVRLDLDPRSAMEIWFCLCASLYCDETTTNQRALVAGLLPQFGRAIAATHFVNYETLLQFQRELAQKPAPPSLDAVMHRLSEGH